MIVSLEEIKQKSFVDLDMINLDHHILNICKFFIFLKGTEKGTIIDRMKFDVSILQYRLQNDNRT